MRTVDVSTNPGCVTESTTVRMDLMKLTVQVCFVVDELYMCVFAFYLTLQFSRSLISV